MSRGAMFSVFASVLRQRIPVRQVWYVVFLFVISIRSDDPCSQQHWPSGLLPSPYVSGMTLLPPTDFCANPAQGILNYNGLNTLAVSLWAQGADGAKLGSLALEMTAMVETSMTPVVNQPMPDWTSRSAT